ncbi:MAG: UDP-galactopyranose mutase [Bacteroidota bacterium]|jgi:UDP-galactopyranose mutase
MAHRFLIVGAGFSGCVLADQLAKQTDCYIDVWDERSHLGGNCHTQRDADTGIMLHQYGPHIFNTDNQSIWDYVNSFVEFRPYVHRVKARSGGKVYSLPINLHTINQFFNKDFTPAQAKDFVTGLGDSSIQNPQNFEEQALKFIGKELYEAFFYGYTKKQWGVEPAELPASILKRIPVRFNYDDNYHNNLFTGIPVEGYTAVMEKMLGHYNITLTLNKKFIPGEAITGYDHIFYTGPIDAFFNYQYGRLGYRTVTFDKHLAEGDYQGATQVNYCDASVPYTRITEHKHFTPWEQHDHTVYFVEYSKETGPDDVPYYPKRLAADKALLKQYRDAAEQQSNVSFLGRLATYRYMDMHHVIGEALQFAGKFAHALATGKPRPAFANTETY